MNIGERIKQRRIELALSQDELAKKVGYKSRSSIQKIESARKLPIDKVQAMATALECSPAVLMGWEDKYGNNLRAAHHDISNEDRKLLDVYHALSPETRAAVDLLIKADQQKP